MIEVLTGYPDHVLAIEASGEVSDHDYEDVLEPAIDARLAGRDTISLLYVLGERFEGYEAEAVWEDAKLGMRTFTKLDRAAIVTDTPWVRRSVKAFSWMMPGHLRVFGLEDLDEATTWVAGDD